MFFRGLLVTVLATIVLSLIAAFVNRSAIETDLTSRIGAIYTAYGNDWVKMSANGRDITISGKAPVASAQNSALESARSVYGVRTVINTLEVSPPVSPYTWSIGKDDKAFILGGHVPSTEMRAEIRKVSRKLYGEADISDRMKLADGAPEEGWKEALDFALQNVEHLGKGEIRISDSVVTIDGEAANVDAYNKIAEAFRGGPEAPDGYILASRVELPAAKPYIWAIEMVGKKVNLTGFVPSVDAHGEVISRVRERFQSEEINDKLKLASGEPTAWDETIIYAINQLKKLRAGKVSVLDDKISISGEALDNPSYDSLVKAHVPEEMRLKAEIHRPAALPYRWNAAWNGSHLELTGHVPSDEFRMKMSKIASAAFPDIQVVDRTHLASGEPKNFPELVTFALSQLKNLKSGNFSISDKDLHLSGKTPDEAVLEKLKEAGKPEGVEYKLNVKGPAEKEPAKPEDKSTDDLKQDAGAISPYVWSSRRIGSEIIMSGYVPSKEIKSKLAALARRIFSGSKISDEMKIGAGAPDDWLAATRLALQQLGRLENGRVQIKDRDFSVRGQTFLASGREELGMMVAEGLPDGFTGTANVLVKEPGEEVKYEECQSLVNSIISTTRITFQTAKADLTQEGRARLDRVVYTLNRCPSAKIEIGGHTDSDGDDASNMTLSQKRAETVKAELAAAGIAEDRMSAKGYGETQPVADNSTPEDKAKNRRIEFKLEQ